MEHIRRRFKLKRMKNLGVFARNRTIPEFDLYEDELTPKF